MRLPLERIPRVGADVNVTEHLFAFPDQKRLYRAIIKLDFDTSRTGIGKRIQWTYPLRHIYSPIGYALAATLYHMPGKLTPRPIHSSLDVIRTETGNTARHWLTS